MFVSVVASVGKVVRATGEELLQKEHYHVIAFALEEAGAFDWIVEQVVALGVEVVPGFVVLDFEACCNARKYFMRYLCWNILVHIWNRVL